MKLVFSLLLLPVILVTAEEDGCGVATDACGENAIIERLEKVEAFMNSFDTKIEKLTNLARFRGYTDWGVQDCRTQTDTDQDKMMDKACFKKFPGSRAATIEEMMSIGDGGVNPIPHSVQGACTKGAINNCAHANNSICVSGHSRRCVGGGKDYPTSFDHKEWGKTGCIKSNERMKRAAMCVVDASWPYVPIIPPYVHKFAIPEIDFDWTKDLIRRFYFQSHEIRPQDGDVEQQIRGKLNTKKLLIDVFYGSLQKGAELGEYQNDEVALEKLVSYFTQ